MNCGTLLSTYCAWDEGGDKHVRAKNNLNLHDKIPNAFSFTLRYLDAR